MVGMTLPKASLLLAYLVLPASLISIGLWMGRRTNSRQDHRKCVQAVIQTADTNEQGRQHAKIQWNLFTADTIGTKPAVLYREV